MRIRKLLAKLELFGTPLSREEIERGRPLSRDEWLMARRCKLHDQVLELERRKQTEKKR